MLKAWTLLLYLWGTIERTGIKRMRYTLVMLSLLLIGTAPYSSVNGQTLPLDSDFRSFEYSLVERLFNLYSSGEVFENTKPFSVAEIDSFLADIDDIDYGLQTEVDHRLADYMRSSIREYRGRILMPSMNAGISTVGNLREGSPTNSIETFSGHLFWKPSDNITAVSSFSLDESLANDPDFSGKVWRGLAGRIDYAYLEFGFSHLTLTFGRDKAKWGPGRRGNLLLSSNSESMDMLKMTGRWGPLRYSTVTAVLDPYHTLINYGDSTAPARINRYLSAHRLEIKPIDMLSVGLSESVVYGGVGRQIEFYYTNPLTWYHGEQLNKNNEDNTFISLDFSFRPRRGVLIYGEFLVDDFQIEKETKGDDEPNELGYVGGFFVSDPIAESGVDISFEYARINNWTYNQGRNQNRYLNNGKLIGHPLGPDRESIYLSARKWFGFGGWIGASYERQNAGEGNVLDDWTRPWLFSAGTYSEKFPTGVVETRDIYGVSALLFGISNVRINVDGFYTDARNIGNVEGEDDSYFEGRLTLTASARIF